MSWNYFSFIKNQEPSIDNDNYGFFKHITPRYYLFFRDNETGKRFQTNDLELKKKRKSEILEDFKQAYWDSYKEGLLTITSCVVNADGYKSISEFIDNKKRLLKKNNIKVLGYVSVLDMGEILFEPHYHILLATTLMKEEQILKFLNDKGKKRYSAELLKTKNGMNKYLNKKELFSKNKKGRCYTKSRKFESILSTEIKKQSKPIISVKSKINTIKKLYNIFDNNRQIIKQFKTVKLTFDASLEDIELTVKNIYQDKILCNNLSGFFAVKHHNSTIIFLQIYLPKFLCKSVKEKYKISKQSIKEYFDYQEYINIEKLILQNAEIVESEKIEVF